jgi:hypothetical protein
MAYFHKSRNLAFLQACPNPITGEHFFGSLCALARLDGAAGEWF